MYVSVKVAVGAYPLPLHHPHVCMALAGTALPDLFQRTEVLVVCRRDRPPGLTFNPRFWSQRLRYKKRALQGACSTLKKIRSFFR